MVQSGGNGVSLANLQMGAAYCLNFLLTCSKVSLYNSMDWDANCVTSDPCNGSANVEPITTQEGLIPNVTRC